MAMPMGKKKRRDSASPAAKPPSSSGAPTACASQAKNSTSDTTVVGMSPEIWLTRSKRLMISAMPLAANGASTMNSAMNNATLPVLTRLTPPLTENS